MKNKNKKMKNLQQKGEKMRKKKKPEQGKYFKKTKMKCENEKNISKVVKILRRK